MNFIMYIFIKKYHFYSTHNTLYYLKLIKQPILYNILFCIIDYNTDLNNNMIVIIIDNNDSDINIITS